MLIFCLFVCFSRQSPRLASASKTLSCPLLVVVPMSVRFQSAAMQLCTEHRHMYEHRIGEPRFQVSSLQDVPQALWLSWVPFPGALARKMGFLSVTCQCTPWLCQKELPSDKEKKENGGEKRNIDSFHILQKGHFFLSLWLERQVFSQGWVDCYLLGLCSASPWLGSTSGQVWESKDLGTKTKTKQGYCHTLVCRDPITRPLKESSDCFPISNVRVPVPAHLHQHLVIGPVNFSHSK